MSTKVTTEKIRRLDVAWSACGEDRRAKEFDAWLAAHDQALREQIAQKIEVEMRRHDNASIGFSAVGDAYAHAARVAREEGDAHRPERCPTCGCEIANRKEDQ